MDLSRFCWVTRDGTIAENQNLISRTPPKIRRGSAIIYTKLNEYPPDRHTLTKTIPFFERTAIPHLTADAVTQMSDEELKKRAYGWRGRAVILRNLELLEKGEKA